MGHPDQDWNPPPIQVESDILSAPPGTARAAVNCEVTLASAETDYSTPEGILKLQRKYCVYIDISC